MEIMTSTILSLEYFSITSILFMIYIDKKMCLRGYTLTLNQKVSLFILLNMSIFASVVYMDDILSLYRLVFFTPFAILITLIDAFEKNVYDEDIINAIIIEMAIIIFNGFSDVEYFISIFSGMSTLFVITSILYLASKSIGMGDVLYFILVGSFFDIKEAVIVFFLSFVIAAIYCIPKLVKNDCGDGMISFTPFISIAAIVIISI